MPSSPSPHGGKQAKKKKRKKKKTAVRIAGELQKWNWMFLRLWEFCGPVNPACILNIPDTVLFKGGQPGMWLWTNPATGRIERHEFDFKLKMAQQQQQQLRSMPAEEKKMLAVRERFLQVRPQAERPEGGHFCVAWYRDGTSEHVDLQAFTRLAKHKQWRASLFALQSYIAPKVASMGLYSVHALSLIHI